MAENGDKVERLLAILVLQSLRDLSVAGKAAQLQRAGFSPAETAKLLGTTSQTIRQALYLTRKTGSAKKSQQTSRRRRGTQR